jgi:hypothetical protein
MLQSPRSRVRKGQPRLRRDITTLVTALLGGVFLTITLFANQAYLAEESALVSVTPPAPLSLRGTGRSYQDLRRWLEQYQGATPLFQPGQWLTVRDQEALKPFLPIAAWEFYFYPEMAMEVVATQHYPLPAGWGAHRGDRSRLDEDGRLVGFTGGGFPFSPAELSPDDPQAGVKVVWNMWWRPGARDYYMPMVSWSRGEKGRLDRQIQLIATDTYFARGDFCLVPGQEEVEAKMLLEYRGPRDLAGTKILTIRYLDSHKEDDGWLYTPAQRKPRRLLSSERTSENPGLDSSREDLYAFYGKVHEHTWKYVGKKAILATMNLADNPAAGGPHQWVPHQARWELRECHVIEGVPRNPAHPYSHKVIFVDSESFWPVWMMAYDRQEKLLRMQQHFLKYSESYAQEEPTQPPYVRVDYRRNRGRYVFLHIGQTVIDVQKPHATFTHCYPVYKEFSAGRAKQFYSLRNMLSGRR